MFTAGSNKSSVPACLLARLIYSSTMTIEAVRSPETSVIFQQLKQRNIAENGTLQVTLFIHTSQLLHHSLLYTM
jgi:hypothetical protein